MRQDRFLTATSGQTVMVSCTVSHAYRTVHKGVAEIKFAHPTGTYGVSQIDQWKVCLATIQGGSGC